VKRWTGHSAGLAASIAGAELGAWTALIVASVDVVSAQFGDYAGNRLGHAFYVLALGVSVLTAAGALYGLGSWAAHRIAARWRHARADWLASALDALPIAAFVLYPPGSWIASHYRELSLTARFAAVVVLLVLPVCAVLAVATGRWLARRMARPSRWRVLAYPALVVASAFVGAACYLGDRTLYPDDYPQFHAGLAGGFIASAAICVALLRAVWAGRARLAGWGRKGLLAIAAVLALSLVVLEQTRIDAFGASDALVFRKLVDGARLFSDVDGDGFAAMLGGRDCAPFDARRSPGTVEVPENEVDEDCSGVDERWPLAPPAPRRSVSGSVRPNVLLISVDTLRADHLGTYGYARPTSPNIDRFASDAVVFLRAFSQASKTWDSVPSFLTGLYPSNLPRDYEHERVRRKPEFVYYLRDSVGLIAEAFAAAGYSTSAFVSVAVLRTMGLERGFQRYQRARNPTRAAKKLLAKMSRPFMLWLHYVSPHAPYKQRRGHDFGKEAIDRYDSEIAFEDSQIATVLAALAEAGAADSTVVILTSDHGEEFGEHGGFNHTRKHYRELLHVPLIVKIPGVAPARVHDVVELVDIVPTLHELCGLPPPRTRLDGQSLLATIAGRRPPELGGAYAEDVRRDLHVSRRAFFDGRFRLIDDRSQDRQELYDVQRDPIEQRDIAAAHPDVVQSLRERIAVRALRSRSPRPPGRALRSPP